MISLTAGQLERLRETLGDPTLPEDLLTAAVTHSSAAAEGKNTDYERLEFLGDAVLQILVTRELYIRFPNRKEGWMSWVRQLLVSEPTLAAIGNELRLPEFTIADKSARKTGVIRRPSVIADEMEALLAVIYISRGMKAAHTFIWPKLLPYLERYANSDDPRDAKTELQELLQRHGTVSISYEVIGHEGQPPQEVFTSRVLCEGKVLALGSGPSKQESQKAAAREALRQLKASESGTADDPGRDISE